MEISITGVGAAVQVLPNSAPNNASAANRTRNILELDCNFQSICSMSQLLAYIGPGAGIAFAGSFLGLIVVTAQMQEDGTPRLEVPPGILVETPPVHGFVEGQVSWRIRAAEILRGSLRLTLTGFLLSIPSASGRVAYSRDRCSVGGSGLSEVGVLDFLVPGTLDVQRIDIRPLCAIT